MLKRVVVSMITLLFLGLIVVIMIYIPEINIILLSAFIYLCIKSIRDVDFAEKYFIKNKKLIYLCIILSAIVIVSLIVYLAIVDPSTLTYTMFVALAIFAADIKRGIEKIVERDK